MKGRERRRIALRFAAWCAAVAATSPLLSCEVTSLKADGQRNDQLLDHAADRDRTRSSGDIKSRPSWIELAPGIRVNREQRLVEFDGSIATDCHNPATPDVYLEVLVCSPNTREHESLVVTAVRPSLIHAALLTIQAEPGQPGDLRTGSGPEGPKISVSFYSESHPVAIAQAWIIDAPTRSFIPEAGFVFAGSRIVIRQESSVYDADGTGVIVGFATFGSEVIALDTLISPDVQTEEPVWIANPLVVPDVGTPVRVRLAIAEDEAGS